MKQIKKMVIVFGVVLLTAGCSAMPEQDKSTAVGAGIGAVGGAVLTGGSAIDTVGGAAVGGVVGQEVSDYYGRFV